MLSDRPDLFDTILIYLCWWQFVAALPILSLSPSLPVNLHEVYFPSGQLGIVQFGEENKNAAIDEPAWHL